jgi:large subunit ribosomal protein L29
MAEKKITARLAELRKLGHEELGNAVEAARRRIFTIRRQRISKPIENIKEIRTNRKEIARILTIQRERQIAARKKAG